MPILPDLGCVSTVIFSTREQASKADLCEVCFVAYNYTTQHRKLVKESHNHHSLVLWGREAHSFVISNQAQSQNFHSQYPNHSQFPGGAEDCSAECGMVLDCTAVD